MPLKLTIQGLNTTLVDISNLADNAKRDVQFALDDFGERVRNDAVVLAPADEGGIRQAIHVDKGNLSVAIVVTKDYAAYMEFGTRKFAAAYVATLPADWQSYAAQFQGKGGGTFAEFIKAIMAWVKRKGIDDKAAYPIALSILRNGVRPHPYIYPSIQKNLPILEADIKDIFK